MTKFVFKMFVHNLREENFKYVNTATQFGKHYSLDIIIINLMNIVIMNKQTTGKKITVLKVCVQEIYVSQGSCLYRITFLSVKKCHQIAIALT